MAGELASRIGARIREAREDLGINQRQLADRIPSDAVNNQRVSDWERGVNKPSDRYMKMIATALDRPVGWFYTEAPADTPDLMEALNGNGPVAARPHRGEARPAPRGRRARQAASRAG
jgi:transcriptional regulator with XRE-family HTH domain